MKGQITFLPQKKAGATTEQKIKRNWENAFQRWSNKESQDGTTPNGKCGFSEICDYCDTYNFDHGRPCVRALNDMLRKTRKKIDYNNADFEKVWDGDF